MGFGNPYGELWHPDMLVEFSQKLKAQLGVEVIALSDTVGTANDNDITSAFNSVNSEISGVEFGGEGCCQGGRSIINSKRTHSLSAGFNIHLGLCECWLR